MSNSTITIKGKTHYLRIYSKHVKTLQEKLKGKSFEEAAIDALDNPVENVVPFLWAILQKKDVIINESEAYDLFDDMVDEGKNAEDFSKLIFEIGEASGFFSPARITMQRAMILKMNQTQEEIMEKMNKKKEEQEENPKQS